MRDNDQNRWEYEVQRHYEKEENKALLFKLSIWGVLWSLFAAILFAALAA